MKHIGFIPALIILAVLFTGCEKNNVGGGAALYGVWVKGSNFGDTLWFMKKNGYDILRKAESFNVSMPVYSEKQYQFENGRLRIQTFAPSSTDFYDIDSFTWTQPGTEFKVQGIQLFMFMSSMNTYFTYHKL